MKFNFLKSSKDKFLNICFKATFFALFFFGFFSSIFFSYDSRYKAGNIIFAPTIVYTLAGSGTEANPYQISNASDLKNLSINVDNGEVYSGKYFKLTNNINLNNEAFSPIGKSAQKSFQGIFDGDNHIIEQLYVNSSKTSCAGLFGFVKNATIKNLIVSGEVWGCNDCCYAGGIVGYSSYKSYFTNVTNLCNVTLHAGGSIIDTKNYAGGIVGYASNRPRFELCKNLGNIYAGTVYSSYSNYKIFYAGGIAGFCSSDTYISKSFNSGVVSAGNGYAGVAYSAGICGYGSAKTISYCYNTGEIKADANLSTTTYFFTLDGAYKVGENGTIYGEYKDGEFLDYEVEMDPTFDGSSVNSVPYGTVTFGVNFNNLIPIEAKGAFKDFTDKSWQKKEITIKRAYTNGISYSGNIDNSYNIGNVSASGYDNVVWTYAVKCNSYAWFFINSISDAQTFMFQFQSSFYNNISRAGIINNNVYYYDRYSYMSNNTSRYKINNNSWTYLYNESGHSKKYGVRVGSSTHYFTIEKAGNSDNIYFYIQEGDASTKRGDIFLSASSLNREVFHKNGYITYENKSSERGTQSSNIKNVFDGDSTWATNPAINNGYPYIKEMYW